MKIVHISLTSPLLPKKTLQDLKSKLKQGLLLGFLSVIGIGICSAAPGDLDPWFGMAPDEIGVGTGYHELDYVGQRYDQLPSDNRILATDNQGRILIGESWYNDYVSTRTQTFIRRLNANGTVDNTFGTAGMVTLPEVGSTDVMRLRGTSVDPVPNIAITTHNDALENTTGSFLSNPSAHWAALSTPPRILVGIGVGAEIHIFAYRSNGQLDTGFGPAHDGHAVLLLPDRMSRPSSFGNGMGMIVHQGFITLATTVDNRSGSGSGRRMAIGRLTSNGLSTSYGNGGVATYAVNDEVGAVNRLADVAVNPTTQQLFVTGRVFSAAAATGGEPGALVLGRLDSSGYPDRSFGVNGFVTHQIPNINTLGMGLSFQSDGRVLVQAQHYNIKNFAYISVLAFNTEGQIDTSFGNDGLVSIQAPFGYRNQGRKSLAVDTQDRIYIGGSTSIPATSTKVPGPVLDADGNQIFSNEAFIARLTWNGQPDSSFGGSGFAYGVPGMSMTASTRDCSDLGLSANAPVCLGDEPLYLQDIGRSRVIKFQP